MNPNFPQAFAPLTVKHYLADGGRPFLFARPMDQVDMSKVNGSRGFLTVLIDLVFREI